MVRVVLSVLTAILFGGVASAQLSVEETRAFVESRVNAAVENAEVAGLVVGVVYPDGSTFTYAGQAPDTEFPRALDGETSLVQIASITKTFTALAMMQLVEDGLVDLDEPVSNYLPEFKDSLHGDLGTVKVKHLFAHRAGYEPVQYPMWPKTADDVKPLSEFLDFGRPQRVFPVGETTVYSNYGYGVAGRIIERVSGQSYADYLESAVLIPLGMLTTTVRLPGVSVDPGGMRPALVNEIAPGQYQSSDGFEPRPFVYSNSASAGSMSATAADMTKFMQAFLSSPPPGEGAVMTALTKEAMTSKLFGDRPGAPDYGVGVELSTLCGHKMISHEGDIFYTKSFFGMLPDQNAGVFVSALSNNGRDVAIGLVKDVLLEIVGEEPRGEEISVQQQGVAPQPFHERLVFEYMSHTTFEKMFLLAFETYTLNLDEAGSLYRAETDTTFTKITPTLYENEETGEQIFLQTDEAGVLKRAYVGSFGFIQPTFFSDPMVFVSTLGASTLAAVIGIILSLVSIVRGSKRSERSTSLAPMVFGLSTVIAISTALVVYVFVTFSGRFPDSMIDYPTGPMQALAYWNYVPALTFIGAVLMMVSTVNTRQGLTLRAFQLIGMPIFLLHVLIMWQWNLIGPNF